jgi:hypothetical protein
VKLLLHLGRAAHLHQSVGLRQVLAQRYRRGHHAHAGGGKGAQEGAVFKLAGNARADALALQPVVDARAHGGVVGGQQHRHHGQAVRKAVGRCLGPQRRGIPGNGAAAQQLAGGAQGGVGGRRAVGQHGVELVQCQLAQKRLKFALMAQQPQVGLVQHGRQQPVHGQLGNAVGDAQVQPQRLAAGGLAHAHGQQLTQRKDVVGLVQRRHAGVGQHQVAPFGAQQAYAQRLFQLAHLGADGLHGHVQPLGGAGNAAFLGHHPEVEKMAVVEALAHGGGLAGLG